MTRTRPLFAVAVAALLLAGCEEESAGTGAEAEPTPETVEAPETVEEPETVASGPSLEAFVAVIEQARTDFAGVTESERQAEILAARHAATCALIESDGRSFNWPATVVQVATTATTGVGLQVEVSHWLFLTTDLNDPAADATTTLIAADTPLAETVSSLTAGQAILLSGTLEEGTEGCLKPHGRLDPVMQISPTTLFISVDAVTPQ